MRGHIIVYFFFWRNQKNFAESSFKIQPHIEQKMGTISSKSDQMSMNTDWISLLHTIYRYINLIILIGALVAQ